MIEDLYNRYAVEVISKASEGSGCLFQSYHINYTYVFTAKHCLTNDNNCDKESIIVRQINKNYEYEEFEIIDVFLDSEYDIAIIIINKIEKLPILNKIILQKDSKVTIYGYPALLKKEREKRQDINCSISFRREEFDELQSQNITFTYENSVPENIEGFSGSGVFYEEKDQLFIYGILIQLKGFDGAYNCLCSIKIEKFENLIQINNLESINSGDSFETLNKDYSLITNVFSISYNENTKPYYLERKVDKIIKSQLKYSKNLWISGDSGVGKTLAVLHNTLSCKNKIVHIDLTCSSTENIDDYFIYINSELIDSLEIEAPIDKKNIYENIALNLILFNNNYKNDLLIFVDEVPIASEKNFIEFLSNFVNISEKFSNLNKLKSTVTWIISTRINPQIHLKSNSCIFPNKTKANKNFYFEHITIWDKNELVDLLILLQESLNFLLSTVTTDKIIDISKGLPGRAKKVIENMIINDYTIDDAIEYVRMENI
jgi:uncharacterized protein YkvS